MARAAPPGQPDAWRRRLKFTPPRNSLFGALLRAPWWVSVLIGTAIGLVAAALLPAEFRVVGALSGFPFAVIGAIAAQRQWRLPSEKRVQQTQAAVGALGWAPFQALLGDALRTSGFDVQPGTGDAVDMVLQRQGRRTLLCARRWKTARLGVEPLRALQAARQREAADGPLPLAVCVCLGEISDNARIYAAAQGITLWGAADLALALRGVKLPSLST